MPAAVPDWLLLGVLLGLAVSAAVASVFALGSYLFPNRTSEGFRSHTHTNSRSHSHSRSRSRFQSGDARRRMEIRQYLQAIDESFAENHDVGEQTVAFYLPKRDVAITFDARAFYAIERTSTHAVLVEHEMPGIYIGSRLPFETPNTVFDADDAEETEQSVDPREAALAVLGLPSNATEQQIKDAYREKVKTVHPDTGGDPEAFQQVKEAYATVSENTE